jgi:hypothetical protein
MKKIGVWNYYEVFNTNNYLLLNKDAGIGDNLLEPFNQLYIKDFVFRFYWPKY